MTGDTTDTTDPADAAAVTPSTWSRLSPRVIWVDLVLTLLSLIPGLIALAITRSSASGDVIWPLVGLAAFGVLSAVGDAVRWLFTHYRVSGSHIELRTGVILRQHRSLRLERIRSVDIEAKLRHRVSGLRMVKVGAGQQASAGESAFTLDALSQQDALNLQDALLASRSTRSQRPTQATDTRPDADTDADADTENNADTPTEPLKVFATFNPRWVVYNMFNIWGYLLALGVIGGAWGILSMVGIDLFGLIEGLYDWGSLGWLGMTVAIVVGVTLLAWIGLTLNYFAEYWQFELARVPGPDGTQLRTRQGLFTTREVNRDENRIRGVQIAEPVWWRWLGITDTHVITTGLDINAMTDPAAILPRVHRDVAKRTAAGVLNQDVSLYDVPLRPHPKVALVRRLWWAILVSLAVTVVLGGVVLSDLLPVWTLWALPVVWALCLTGAVIAYRALGHAEYGPYLILRSGLFYRATVVLRRDAVSTVGVRESVLQRWLGLRTVSVMTAAGYGGYDLPDVGVRDATALAEKYSPGILDGFTHELPMPQGRPTGAGEAGAATTVRIPAPDLARGVMLLLIAMAYAVVHAGFGFGESTAGLSWWDQVAAGVSALVLDNRAFPMFAILFGYGLAWSVRRQRERQVYRVDTELRLRRRAWMLLAIGAVHAAPVFPGEILTSYGLAILLIGWLLFRSQRTLRRAAVVTGVFYLVTVTVGMIMQAYSRDEAGSAIAAIPGYTTAEDWVERIIGVPIGPVFLAVTYPLLLLVILGFMAGKARLLEEPAQHRVLLVRTAVWGIGASVLGAVPSVLVMSGVLETGWVNEGLMMSLQVLTGVAGGAGYVALFALFSDRLVAAMGRVMTAVMAMGKRSLTFYLLNSVLVAVVLHPDLVGLSTGPLGALGVAAGAWLVSLSLATVLERAGCPGPMDQLMARVVR